MDFIFNIRFLLLLNISQEVIEQLIKGRSYRMLCQSEGGLDVQLYLATKYRIKPINTHQTPISSHKYSNLNQSSHKEDQQFFSFVRNRKYKQAYVLGLDIMKNRPHSNTVATFCQFLKRNFIQEQSNNSNQINEEDESQQSSESQSEQSSQQQNNSEENQNDSQQQIQQQINKEKNNKKKSSDNFKKVKQKKNQNIYKKEEILKPYIPKLALQSSPQIRKEKLYKKQRKNQEREEKGPVQLVSKEIVKNIINIKLNQQNNHDRERRYRYATLADNFNKKCVKLPWIKNSNIQSTNNNLKIKQNQKENIQNKEIIVKQNKIRPNTKIKDDEVLKQITDQKQSEKNNNNKLNNYKIRNNVSFTYIKNRLDDKRNSTNSISLKTLENIKKLNNGLTQNKNDQIQNIPPNFSQKQQKVK